ncbi:MAG TPA: hypothetical protein VJG83_06365 [archaeon]|nr:hypothetical protein [archaeon]
MIEFELVVKEVEKLYDKEKSIRRKIYLETALKSLREYSKIDGSIENR